MRSKVMFTTVVISAFTLALAVSAFGEGGKFSDTIEAKKTLCYPLELLFKRPSGVLKTSFPPVTFSHDDSNQV